MNKTEDGGERRETKGMKRLIRCFKQYESIDEILLTEEIYWRATREAPSKM